MLALELETLNDRRRMASTEVLREAETMLALDPELAQRPIIVVHGKVWPSGLFGTGRGAIGRSLSAAGGRSDRRRWSYSRVCPFGARPGHHGRDRAIANPVDALWRSSPSGRRRVLPDKLELFSEAFGRAVVASGVDLPFTAKLRIDAHLPSERVTMATVESVGRLQPFGMGNEQPLFRIRNVQMRQYDVIGTDRSHLRLQLGLPGGTLKAVMFGAAERSRELVAARRIDVVGLLKTDTWNGQRRLDFEVKDFEPV